MELRALGNSGLRVSLVGLGCNNFGGRTGLEDSRKVIHHALDLGINLLDTADMYSNGESESVIGQVLGDRRKEVVLATKFGWPMDRAGLLQGNSRRYLMRAVEASLRRLRTDWIDLYQIHQPDPLTPIEETLRALDDLVRQGKVRYLGCSNFAAWQVVDAQWTARHHGLNALVASQDEYSLLARGIEKDLLPAIKHCGLGLLPYFPLASGLLSGKYRRDAMPTEGRLATAKFFADRTLTPENWERVERLAALCDRRGHSLLELAFSWLAANPAVSSIIAGATRPEQLDTNVKAVGWTLSADELAEIDRLTAA